MACAQHAAHNPKFEKMRLFRHPRRQHLDYGVKVATTQENKPPTQGTRQWTFTTPRWRCGSILLPSLNAGVPEPTGGNINPSFTNFVGKIDQEITWNFCVVRLLYPVSAHNLIIHFIPFEELSYIDCQDVAQYTIRTSQYIF